MKKSFSVIFCIVLLACTVVPSFANSAPSYWEAYPYSEVLAADESSPIVIGSEQLIFDFSKDYEYGHRYAPVAKVTASYEMSNPTDNTLPVQMAFPFVSSLTGLSVSAIDIRVDEVSVPFELYLGHEVNMTGDSSQGFMYGGFDITKEELVLPGFDMSKNAKLYEFELNGFGSENMKFEIRSHVDANKTRLIGKGFHSSSFSDQEGASLGAWIKEGEKLEILVFGGDFEFTHAAYTDTGQKVDEALYHYEIRESLVDPKKYLLAEIYKNIGMETAGALSDTQLLNLYLNRIWQTSLVSGFSTLEEGLSASYSDRIITLIYTVAFPPGATRNVSVSYLADGVMDRRETLSPKYSYTYLLSPAKHWADFGSLDVEIIMPEEAPYLIESSLAFEKDGERRYTARLNGLPEEELAFTVYKNKEVTFVDKAQKTAQGFSYILFFFWPFIAVGLVAGALLIVIIVIRRKYNS